MTSTYVFPFKAIHRNYEKVKFYIPTLAMSYIRGGEEKRKNLPLALDSDHLMPC